MDNDQDTEAFFKENEMELRYKKKGVQRIVNAETGKTVYIDINTNKTLGKQELVNRGIIKGVEGMKPQEAPTPEGATLAYSTADGKQVW